MYCSILLFKYHTAGIQNNSCDFIILFVILLAYGYILHIEFTLTLLSSHLHRLHMQNDYFHESQNKMT